MGEKFGAQHHYTTAGGDTLWISVTNFEICGALETDECFFLIDFDVLGYTMNDGTDIEGSYPKMTDSLADDIKDHIGPEHYTIYIGPDDEY